MGGLFYLLIARLFADCKPRTKLINIRTSKTRINARGIASKILIAKENYKQA